MSTRAIPLPGIVVGAALWAAFVAFASQQSTLLHAIAHQLSIVAFVLVIVFSLLGRRLWRERRAARSRAVADASLEADIGRLLHDAQKGLNS